MKPAIVTHPGKNGDLVFAVPIIRRITEIYGGPVQLLTTPYCYPAISLLIEELDLVADVGVYDAYRAHADQPGLQPIEIPVPDPMTKDGHRDVFHLGYRRFPAPHEDLTACMGAAYGLEWSGGPWLRRARVDPKGPVIVHAPLQDHDYKPHLRAIVNQLTGREVILVGTVREFVAYQEMNLDRIEGVRLVETESLLDVWKYADGASGFFGVASAPAVVCAGAGLPSKWVLQDGAPRWCVPMGCDVRVVKLGAVR